MVYPIFLYGNSVLRKEAEDISLDYPNLKTLIEDMYETMHKSEGIGLAAPQIGLPIRLAVIDLSPLSDDMPEYKDYKHAFINPHILETEGEELSLEEGCLSLPGINESVKRKNRIHVTYFDENLQKHDEWVEGYLARVMQHEFDHLDGHVFIDRIFFKERIICNIQVFIGDICVVYHQVCA